MQQRVSETYPTATEQQLLSQAVIHSVDQLSPVGLRDRLVFVDATYLADVPGKEFILGEFRARLLTSGVRLVNERQQAKIICELRTGGIGIDRYNFLVGIPSVTLPVGNRYGGINVTPELALLKKQRQRGFATVGYVAYWAETGELIASSGPYTGRALREDYWLFSTEPRTTGNIPAAEQRR